MSVPPPDLPPLPDSPMDAAFQGREKRRKKRIAWTLTILSTCAALLGGCLLTQPVFVKQGPSAGHRVDPLRDPGADPVRLRAHVQALSGTFLPRDWKHVENLDKAADYIKAQFQTTGAQVSEQTFTVKNQTYRNIIAKFGPRDGEGIVAGAHYDAFEELPGADDNASGVSGLLELARLLGQRPPACPVELVAYTLEEPPFFRTSAMGSSHHAQSLRAATTPLRGMLVLEMIGFFSDEPGSQDYPLSVMGLLYPSKGNFIAVVGDLGSTALTRSVKKAMIQASDLPVKSMNAPRFVPGVDFSDHHPYWDAGYKAVMITDGAFNRNKAYHTGNDVADRLDYVRMGKVVDGVEAAIRSLAP